MRLEGRNAGRVPRELAVAIEVCFHLIAYKLSSFLSHSMTPLAMSFQVFEMAPSLFMIEVRKAMGDTLDYHKVRTSLFISCNRVDNSRGGL